MQARKITYYPTTLEAVHLLVLFIFLQSLVDFPLALYDYNHDTNWLSNPWISFISTFSITTFIFYFGFINSRSTLKQVFALKLFNPLILISIIIILPALQYLVGFLNIAVDKILPAPPWFWELFERIFDNHFGFWGAALKVVIIAPIIEESLFRGIIMHGLMRNYKSGYAIFLSGLLFSVYHLNPWQMTYTFFLGLFLGWLMVRTHSLPLTILAHAINNLIVLLSITFQNELSNQPIFNLPLFLNIGISVIVMILGIALIVFLTFDKKKIRSMIRPPFDFWV